MNVIAAIILVTLFADALLHGAADVLNLKTLRRELPDAFRGVYDEARYARSQDYLRANTRFSWAVSVFDLLLLLVFWFGKGFPMLDGWVRSLNLGPVMSGLVFIGVLILGKAVLSLPFNLYATFVIEERFGFNKTTWKTYIIDLVKGLLLAAALGGPLLALVLAFFEYAGPHAWAYCWIAVTLYSLIVQFIAPAWILPLFNKFEPLEEGELRDVILSYARSIKFPLKNVFVMDGSRRSSKSNAFFTGFGKHKRIVLFDTLVERHTVGELLAVLAHEMGHYKEKHIIQRLLLGVMQTGAMFFLLSLFISSQALFDAFYMKERSVYAGLVFFGVLYSAADFFAGLVMQMISRKHEYAADRFAVDTTGDAQAMADALKKISAHNLSNLAPHPFYVFLNYSHPPVLARIEAIGAR